MLSDPNCKLCPLSRSAQHVCIPGRGDDKPTILFVGQAPGWQEDVKGKCFVGPAGQLLRDAIKNYIKVPYRLTNLVKCYPPNDRDPLKEEITACRPYLDDEIKEYQPDYIVTLGNVPLKALVKKSGVTTWSGRIVGEVGRSKVFALLHPSFILRYPANLPKFEAGFRELARLTTPGYTATAGPEIREVTPAGLLSQLDEWRDSMVAVDYETTGIPIRAGGRVRCVGFSDGQSAVWIDVEKHGSEALDIVRLFMKSKTPKAAHNFMFEINVTQELFGFEPVAMKHDTMLYHYLTNENTAHNLESVAMEELQTPPWDIDAVKKQNGWTWETTPMRAPVHLSSDFKGLGYYCGMDALRCAQLVKPLRAKMTPEVLNLYKTVVRPQAKTCARLERTGIYIDAKWADLGRQRLEKEIGALYDKLMQDPAVLKLKRRMEKAEKELNLNSPAQLRKLFYGILHMPVIEETNTGQPSVREPVLERIKGTNQTVTDYLDWKSKETLKDRFLVKVPTFRDERGLVHPSYNPGRIVTGRIAVTKPPMQTIPTIEGDEFVRGMIRSRFEDGKILSVDYKQLEICLVASEAGEEKLLKAIAEKEDIHGLTAREVFGEKFVNKSHCQECKRLRNIAKRINFGIVYGISPHSIAAEFNMSDMEAEAIFKRFRLVYPKIFHWMNRVYASLRRDGFVVSQWGRVRRLPEILSADDRTAARMLRQAGNFPIQSAGADITNTAMSLVDKELRKTEAKSLLILQVHDSLVLDLHPEEVNTIPPRVVEIMTTEVQSRCPWLKVKLEVDATVEERWGGSVEVVHA